MSKSYATGVILVLIAAMSWSTAGLFTRVVTTDIPTTLFWRAVFGCICVLLIFLAVRRPKHLSETWRFRLGEAVVALFSALGMMCFISAFFHTSIANVSFIYGAMPLVTMLMAWLILRDTITPTAIIATLFSCFGAAILVWGGQDFNDLLGIALAFLMTLFMAGTTVSAKFFPEADAMKAAYLSAFMAAVFMLPFATLFPISFQDMVWLALYGIVNIGFGFGVYLLGVARIPALAAALIGLSEIPLAPIWAYLLFNEQLTIAIAIGGSLILLASTIYIVSASKKSPRTFSDTAG